MTAWVLLVMALAVIAGLAGSLTDARARVRNEKKWTRRCCNQRDAATTKVLEMSDELSAEQDRYTALLERLAFLVPEELHPLQAALEIARSKHPEGSDLLAIASELGELADAVRSESPERVTAEAYDLAITALRFALGERNE